MQNLLWVHVELAVYRKGCLTVQLNFQEGIMTWMESRQWCNNFVRSLSDEQVRDTMGILREAGLLTTLPATGTMAPEGLAHADAGDRPDGAEDVGSRKGSSLTISLIFADHQADFADEEIDPSTWAVLRSQIERLSRVPFQL
jgi:hypothetical protein